VTLTLPVLNGARDVVFLAAGEEKAAAVERAFFGPRSNAAPASMVRPPRGRLTVLLDPAAGGERARAAASQP
jgi:6-phosphogluconolactonase